MTQSEMREMRFVFIIINFFFTFISICRPLGSPENPLKSPSGNSAYKNQPGKIEDFTPGHSSVSEKDRREVNKTIGKIFHSSFTWNDVKVIFYLQRIEKKKMFKASNANVQSSDYTSQSIILFILFDNFRFDIVNHPIRHLAIQHQHSIDIRSRSQFKRRRIFAKATKKNKFFDCSSRVFLSFHIILLSLFVCHIHLCLSLFLSCVHFNSVVGRSDGYFQFGTNIFISVSLCTKSML